MKKTILAVTTVAAILIAATLTLPGCSALIDRENAAAAKLQAEASLERARADTAKAEASAATERSAARIAESDASLTRWLTLLPALALTCGMVLAGLVAAIALGRQQPPPATDPTLVLLLHQHEHQLRQLEQATYHQIALQHRQQPITIYKGETND